MEKRKSKLPAASSVNANLSLFQSFRLQEEGLFSICDYSEVAFDAQGGDMP